MKKSQQPDAITDVSGGNYVDKIEVSGNKQLEVIKDFDDKSFEFVVIYDTSKKNKLVFKGKYNALALKILNEESSDRKSFAEAVTESLKSTATE